MPPKISLLKLTQTNAIKKLYENNHIIQDMLVPVESLEKSIELFDEIVSVYPLWLCPFNLPYNPGMVHPPLKTKSNNENSRLYVDIGVYGVPKVENFQPKESTRRIEKFVSEVHGYVFNYLMMSFN